MKYPKCLEQKNRNALPNERIKSKNYMYVRHKPNVDWKEGDTYPDFSRLKSDQSCNWSAYSIPIWARFTDEKEFKYDYGIYAYSVKTIIEEYRNFSKTDRNNIIEHKPIQYNYSHCQLNIKKNISHKKKRELRLRFKIRSFSCLKPFENYKQYRIIIDFINMWRHRLLTYF